MLVILKFFSLPPFCFSHSLGFMKTNSSSLLFTSTETSQTTEVSPDACPVLAPALEDPTTGILVNIVLTVMAAFKWIMKLFL